MPELCCIPNGHLLHASPKYVTILTKHLIFLEQIALIIDLIMHSQIFVVKNSD